MDLKLYSMAKSDGRILDQRSCVQGFKPRLSMGKNGVKIVMGPVSYRFRCCYRFGGLQLARKDLSLSNFIRLFVVQQNGSKINPIKKFTLVTLANLHT
jgi:hypothetical protein